MDNDDIMSWIATEMQRQGMSVKQLAKISGYAPLTVQNLLKGKTTPMYATVRTLVESLGYRVEVTR